jgi:hypothetical protein
VLEANSASWCGGGLAALASEVVISQCEITGNRAFRPPAIQATSGGGVWGTGGSLELTDSVLRENSSGSGLAAGAGLAWEEASPTVSGCLIEGNHSSWFGGGLFLPDGGEVFDCVIRDNLADVDFGGGIHAVSLSSVLHVTDCLFTGNRSPTGSAIAGRNLVIDGCTLVRNEGPAIAIPFENSFVQEISRSIVAFNQGPALAAADSMPHAIDCTDIFGNTAGDWIGPIAGDATQNGNFSSDPFFCGLFTGDFTLRSNSPCAPEYSNGCGLVGALPVGCGAVRVEAESWGRIKAAYRGTSDR